MQIEQVIFIYLVIYIYHIYTYLSYIHIYSSYVQMWIYVITVYLRTRESAWKALEGGKVIRERMK